jgi:hypothetical protein
LAFIPLAAAAGGPAIVFTSDAGAADAPLVTDYANYPSPAVAGAPAGCDGHSFLNPMYTTSNGGSGPDLSALPPLRQGDSVTFTWSGMTPGCDASQANVTLSVKAAHATTFDPADKQHTVAAVTVSGAAHTATIVMPSLAGQDGNCAYQFDAVMGYALAMVGPTGSYYSAAIRLDNERSMLASSQLGRYPTCEAPAAPPPSPLPAPAPTTVTTAPALPVVLPTTSAPPVVTQVEGTQAANAQPANTQPANNQAANTQPANTQAANTQAPGISTQVAGARVQATQAQGAQGQAVIPATGANTRPTFMAAMAALLSGAGLLSLPSVRRARARTESN